MESSIMKKAKIGYPYFMLLVLTSIFFGCIYILEGNVFFGWQDGDNKGKQESVRVESISGNSVSGNYINGQCMSGNDVFSSGNSVSGNSVDMVLDTEEAVQEYLSETLFIGDSRTASLQEYAGWDTAHFYVKYGLTIWDVLDEKIADYDGEKITVDEALQKQSFKRIYIMLGINELGRGTPETFSEQYGRVIERIRQLQPDAVIIVEAIIHVTIEKDEERTYINNTEINARNEKIKEMAEQYGVCWLDANEVMDEKETNCLGSE